MTIHLHFINTNYHIKLVIFLIVEYCSHVQILLIFLYFIFYHEYYVVYKFSCLITILLIYKTL